MPSNSQWPWRDGLALKYYNGYLIMLGGWNTGAFTPGPSTNEIWVSNDDGLTWTYLGTAPWTPRHYFGCEIKNNVLFIMGGDPYVPAKDVWTYDLSQGVLNLAVSGNWIQRTSDWGVVGNDRILQAYFQYNGKIRMCGGQIGLITPTMLNEVVELDETTWQWVSVGDLPTSYSSTCIVVQQGANTWLYAGGRYLNSGHDHGNFNLYKSLNGGFTWTLDSALPSGFNGFMYANGCLFDNKLWLLNGATNTNQLGLWFKDGGNDWTINTQEPLARHASSMATNGSDKMWIVSGNTVNDVIKITKQLI